MRLREFERRLKRLNRNISIYATSDMSRPAGVWVLVATYHGGEYEEMCGVEKGDVREFPTYSPTGKMLTGGWHRVLHVLRAKGHIKLHESRRYFGDWDLHHEPYQVFGKNEIDRAIDSHYSNIIGYKRIEDPLNDGKTIDVPIYNTADTIDIGRMIAKNR